MLSGKVECVLPRTKALEPANEVQVVLALFMCLFFYLFIPLKQNKNEEETIFSSSAFGA
jgi:hypothetical protein